MLRLFVLLFIASCEMVQNRYYKDFCFKLHSSSEVFRVQKQEGTKVYLKETSSGKVQTISSMDRGWSQVDCEAPHQKIQN